MKLTTKVNHMQDTYFFPYSFTYILKHFNVFFFNVILQMNQTCKVCGEPAAGFHFGAFTCEGCKVRLISLEFNTLIRFLNYPPPIMNYKIIFHILNERRNTKKMSRYFYIL